MPIRCIERVYSHKPIEDRGIGEALPRLLLPIRTGKLGRKLYGVVIVMDI
jgi:hypothetical protein